MNADIISILLEHVKSEEQERKQAVLQLAQRCFPQAKPEYTITRYPEGVTMSGKQRPGNPQGIGGGIRSEIKTFSLASRRRFREFLIRHEQKKEEYIFSVTFTVPGVVRSVEEYKRLFEYWRMRKEVKKWGVVYRCEVQKRGALHWHCLITMTEGNEEKDYTAGQRAALRLSSIFESWWLAVDHMWPMVKYEKPFWFDGVNDYITAGPLSWTPGAMSCKVPGCFCGGAGHMILVESMDRGRQSWYRYMADHATKFKRDQIGENIGRHWGVLGRKHFVRLKGENLTLTVKQYNRFRRAYERLATHRVLDEREPSGVRLGKRPKRGRYGTSQCFMNPVTVERLYAYATSDAGTHSKPS